MAAGLSEIDLGMLKMLLESGGKASSKDISKVLRVPLSTIQRRRRRLEEEYISTTYSFNIEKLGMHRVDILVTAEGGQSRSVARGLLDMAGIIYAARTLGEHTIDLKVEALVRTNQELSALIDSVKAVKGVRDAFWTQTVEVVGRKELPNGFGLEVGGARRPSRLEKDRASLPQPIAG